MKEAMVVQTGKVAELSKITDQLVASRNSYHSKYKGMAAQCSSYNQANQALTQRVRELEMALRRMVESRATSPQHHSDQSPMATTSRKGRRHGRSRRSAHGAQRQGIQNKQNIEIPQRHHPQYVVSPPSAGAHSQCQSQ